MRTVQTSLTMFLLFAVTSLAVAADKPLFVVRDADGVLVGLVLEQTVDLAVARGLTNSLPLWVARKIPSSWIFLPLTANAVWTTGNLTPFLYERDYCDSQPLLPAPRTRDEVHATVVFDTQVYWSAGPGSDRIIRSQGVRMADPATCHDLLLDGNLCCTTLSKDETHFAAETSGVALAQLNLRPPFRLEQATVRPTR